MRIGVFSDIHGNIRAFDRVWKGLLKESCDLYCCLGDICGYYYSQNEVIDALRDIDGLICVMGNHDKKFLDCVDNDALLDPYTERFGGSLEFLKAHITQDQLAFLRSLPSYYVHKELNFAMFHGSPWDHLTGYVYPTDPIDRFRELDYKYVLMGHTHYPMHRKAGEVEIVNPGSVGQSRDEARASYAVLDLKTGSVAMKRVAYDTGLLIKDLKDRNETNTFLYEVLQRKPNG